MTEEAFWQLIDRAVEQPGDRSERTEWLTEELTRLPLPQIAEFESHLRRAQARVNTWLAWGAATLVCGGLCSDDGFWYFQLWLVGLGRTAFEAAAADPDSLAAHPEIRRLAATPIAEWTGEDWPDWEHLDYVAGVAFREVAADGSLDDLVDAPPVGGPTGNRCTLDNPAELATHLPRLAALFPATATTTT